MERTDDLSPFHFCRLVRAMTVARCRGAAPMPAFSPATLFSPRAEKYLNIEIYLCFLCHTFVRTSVRIYYSAEDWCHFTGFVGKADALAIARVVYTHIPRAKT